jgi:pimeloyl-ACP methyl ester carboxylesterase
VQDYTVAGFADDLAWLCAQLGVVKPVVVGHSMGGNVAFELSRRHPDLPAAIVAVDSAISPPPWLRSAVTQHAAALRAQDFRDTQRQFVSGFFLPTDDPEIKEDVLERMSSSAPPQAAISSLEDHILIWDGTGAAAACRVPALHISATTPPSDMDELRSAQPVLVTGQTVGAGHFNNRLVPDQVNAMIDRFLAITGISQANAATPAREAIPAGSA